MRNPNVDQWGIQNLLRLLEGRGFTQADLRKIAVHIARKNGADIRLFW